MSMTRAEAIEVLENGSWWDLLIPVTTIEGRIEDDKLHEALDLAIAALHPVSREQVEQVWRSYWDRFSNGYADGYEVYDEWQCRKCGFEVETDGPETLPQFCPSCGAPMTGEAVQMVLERLEALHETVE